MLGTDYPFPLGELQPGLLIESMEEFDDVLKVLNVFLSFHNLSYKLESYYLKNLNISK